MRGEGIIEPCRTLAAAAAGQGGVITGIDGDCSEVDQLESLGVAAGVAYRVVGGGEPIILSVLGTRVAVSRELAGRIAVTRGG